MTEARFFIAVKFQKKPIRFWKPYRLTYHPKPAAKTNF